MGPFYGDFRRSSSRFQALETRAADNPGAGTLCPRKKFIYFVTKSLAGVYEG
jgi:hypothetical protein